jgi:Ca-activated chloride channel family protein
MLSIDYPWLLCLLFVPFLLNKLLTKRTLDKGLTVPFFTSLKENIHLINHEVRQMTCFYLSVWACLVIALTRPSWIGEPMLVSTQAKPMILALDISGSMSMDDMMMNQRPVDRLTVVKNTALSFIDKTTDIEIGLILFGTKAYLKTPFTLDKAVLSDEIKDATVGLAGNNTAIGDALGLAIKQFQKIKTASKVVILLTDGVSNAGILSSLKAANLAREYHVKVYTIGLVPDLALRQSSMFLFSATENIVDEDTLKMIAEKTKGAYFRATDANSLNQIYQHILALESHEVKQPPYRPKQDFIPWVLGFAMLLILAKGIKNSYQGGVQ